MVFETLLSLIVVIAIFLVLMPFKILSFHIAYITLIAVVVLVLLIKFFISVIEDGWKCALGDFIILSIKIIIPATLIFFSIGLLRICL